MSRCCACTTRHLTLDGPLEGFLKEIVQSNTSTGNRHILRCFRAALQELLSLWKPHCAALEPSYGTSRFVYTLFYIRTSNFRPRLNAYVLNFFEDLSLKCSLNVLSCKILKTKWYWSKFIPNRNVHVHVTNKWWRCRFQVRVWIKMYSFRTYICHLQQKGKIKFVLTLGTFLGRSYRKVLTVMCWSAIVQALQKVNFF